MRARRAPEHGIAAPEYIGIALLAAVVIGALVAVVTPNYRPQVERAWCLITNVSGSAECAAQNQLPVASPSPSQVTPWYADSRLTPEERAIQGRYVGLGDSFSSGEGGSEYEPGTDDDNQWKKWWDQHGLWPGDVRQNMCHRSTEAYAQRINSGFDFKGGYTFRACSGAVIDDFYQWNHEVHNADHPNRQNEDEPPQLDALTEDTSLVTFSIGGNDVRFADVLTECVKSTALTVYDSISGAPPTYCKDSAVARDAESRIDGTAARLQDLLADIRERSPNARVIIVGYPKFFPDPPDPGAGLIQGPDQEWINSKVDELNDALYKAVMAAGGPDAGFEFVDPRDAFKGCEIGTANSCMNSLRVGFGDNFDSGRPVSNGSFHPNDEGHRRLAELIAEQIRKGG